MNKNIDLTKVNISGKGILYLIIGIAVLLIAWKVANWGVNRLSGTITGESGSIFDGVI